MCGNWGRLLESVVTIRVCGRSSSISGRGCRRRRSRGCITLLLLIIGIFGCDVQYIVSMSCEEGWHTELMANPGTSSDTTNTGGRKHSSGVALILLLLFRFVGISRCARRCVVIMATVSVSVTEKTTLVVTSSSYVGSIRARRSVGTGR